VFGDSALAGLEDTGNEVEKGGLAGTVGTKNSDTGVHAVKVEAVIVIQMRFWTTHSIPNERCWYKKSSFLPE